MKLSSAGPPEPPPRPPVCQCFDEAGNRNQPVPTLHDDVQDTSCDAWQELVARIERAARDGVEEFSPLDDMSEPDRARIVTLPQSIDQLTRVRTLELFGSYLSRIPPEIGAMRALEYLDVYMSYRLHFLPFELTRCSELKDSRMSTRALFGNFKNRGHFPNLLAEQNAATLARIRPASCSVCGGPLTGPEIRDRWITLSVGTDRVPLLLVACSQTCIGKLPAAAQGYVANAHTGGSSVVQPPPEFNEPFYELGS